MAFEPSNQKDVIITDDKVQIFIVDFLPDYDKEDYDITDNKDLEKYISDIEKLVRNSFEYQQFVQYARMYMDMNKCSFYDGINNMESTKIKIHIHHSPLTLYEIVVTVIAKRQYYGDNLSIEQVAKEVLSIHYKLMVGLIPLCETVHELVHNEYIFIPNDAVFGLYQKFIDLYDQFIPSQVKEKLQRIEKYSKVYDELQNMKVLQPHYIYLDFAGTYKLPKTEDILNHLNTRIEALQRNDYSIEPKPFVIFNTTNK